MPVTKGPLSRVFQTFRANSPHQQMDFSQFLNGRVSRDRRIIRANVQHSAKVSVLYSPAMIIGFILQCRMLHTFAVV